MLLGFGCWLIRVFGLADLSLLVLVCGQELVCFVNLLGGHLVGLGWFGVLCFGTLVAVGLRVV